MVWKPKQQALVTSSEVAKAKSYLPPNPDWTIGVIATEGHIQYIGAMHPNASGDGQHPGVEVWTDIASEQVGAKLVEDLGTTSPEERELVISAITRYGYPRNEAYHIVRIESAWKPHNYYHSSKVASDAAASGLIGFMPTTLYGLGWRGPTVPGKSIRVFEGGKWVNKPQPDMREFRKLSSREQAAWVGRYFRPIAGKWKFPGDAYVAVAGSKFIGWPNDAIAYTDNPAKSNDAVDLNPGWNHNKDGVITVGEIRQTVLNQLSKAVPEPVPIPPEWLAELDAELAKGGSPMAPPKVPDPDSLLSRSEWLSLLALSLLEDADKWRYCLLPPKTDSVIRRYQKANGLDVDGIPGQETLGKLLK